MQQLKASRLKTKTPPDRHTENKMNLTTLHDNCKNNGPYCSLTLTDIVGTEYTTSYTALVLTGRPESADLLYHKGILPARQVRGVPRVNITYSSSSRSYI